MSEQINNARLILQQQVMLELLRLVQEHGLRLQAGVYGGTPSLMVHDQWGRHLAGLSAGWGGSFYVVAEQALHELTGKLEAMDRA